MDEQTDVTSADETPEATRVEVRSGLGGVVQAGEASITNGVAFAVVGQENAQLRQGGAFAVVAGNTMTINQGGGQLMIAGNSINIEEGGGGVMLTGQATVKQGFVAVLISGATDLQDGAKVLLSTQQALIFGAAFGLVYALVRRIFRR